MKTMTREMPFPPAGSRGIVHKLKSLLISIAQEPRMAPFLLWLLFMGGIASRGTTEQAWFTDSLAKAIFLHGEPPTWMIVKKSLQGILWVDMIHDVPCMQLCNEVEETGIARNGQDR